MSKKFFAIQQAEREADIYIFGDIVKGAFWDDEVSAHSLLQEIKDLDVDVINVHIDSYGGSVSEGWAIYNTLKNHPAKIKTYGDGFVASAALFPFMAGEERYASTLSAYYFHRVVIGVTGYSETLRAAADEADMMTDIGINAFTENTNLSAEEIKELMTAETWLAPSDALEKGIATAVVADKSQNYTQSIKRELIQQVLKKEIPPASKPPEEKRQEEQKKDTIPHIMQMWGNILSKKEE